MGKGLLRVELRVGDDLLPVINTPVIIKDRNGNVLFNLKTDGSGNTENVVLDAPDISGSLTPTDGNRREPTFGSYEVEIPFTKRFKREIIKGVQVFDTLTSILPIKMLLAIPNRTDVENTVQINIPEERGVDMNKNPRENSEMPDANEANPNNDNLNWGNTYVDKSYPIANEVVIPDNIVVHLGLPASAAKNVKVTFKDYIKNVASSEIYPTWPIASLYSNIYCQISLVLNRVNTFWYKSRGYEFDITNSTAVDQYFVEGRNIFENISQIVDQIFNLFIRRAGRKEPFYAEYCNGTSSTCPGLSQWGTVTLADKGYTPIQILHYYYPKDIEIVESTNFQSEAVSYPGSSLKLGSSGENVKQLQFYLNRIAANYPLIPIIPVLDGIYGADTKNAVIQFQKTFNQTADGIVGKQSWYKVIQIYVAVKKLAELTSEGERIGIGAYPPTSTLSIGSRGEDVVELQYILNYISMFYSEMPSVLENGVYTNDTKDGVMAFQEMVGIKPDGMVGPKTWQELYDMYHYLHSNIEVPEVSTPYPGKALKIGSSGSEVLLMQTYLNVIANKYPEIPQVTADGYFGAKTAEAVKAFQKKFGLTSDGVIGKNTWNKIVYMYNEITEVPTPGTEYPGTILKIGSKGTNVLLMQKYLNAIANKYPSIPKITADGSFGAKTAEAVKAFQKIFGLTADGIIGKKSWDKIVEIYNSLDAPIESPQYPGNILRIGSSGQNVLLIQQYLLAIANKNAGIPKITADGTYGQKTSDAVRAFQKAYGLSSDGLIGKTTWNKIVEVYNSYQQCRKTIDSNVLLYDVPIDNNFVLQSKQKNNAQMNSVMMVLVMKKMFRM